MRKQAGQAFILVLILLGIGALLVVPALRLTGTSLTSSQIVERQVKGLYAADAAQEYILWKLMWDDLAGDLMDSYNPETPDEPPSAHYDLDVCGVSAGVTVVMRAEEGQGGTTLATDDKIKPTKTVSHQYLPDSVPDKREVDYLYTISLDYLSDINEDNPKVYLDAIYDLPPSGITEYVGPSELSLDGGETWLPVPDPDYSKLVSKGYIKWPADYEWDPVATGTFSSHPEFLGIEDFEVRQVKMLRFKMRGTLDNNQVHCNWVVLKMDDEEHPNTLSGPQAPIDVGNPDNPGSCEDSSVVAVSKTSDPEIIPPGETTPVEYTISITNLYTQTRSITEITDYLPPEFIYLGPTSSEIVNPSEDIQILEPEVSDPININGVDRREVQWTTQKFPLGNDISIAAGQTLRLTFWAEATKDVDVSGSYYNEVIVLLKETALPSGWGDIGVLAAEYGNNYSWLTGAVIVPAYDSSSDSEGITIDANMSLVLGGITITSWQVR
ncbi:hypothetical protein ES703_11584 [subsurface metagenome]